MNIIKQKIHTFRIIDRMIDLLVLFVSIKPSMLLVNLFLKISSTSIAIPSLDIGLILFIILIWMVLIQIFENGIRFRSTSYMQIFQNTTFTALATVTTTFSINSLFGLYSYSFPYILCYSIFTYILLTLKRLTMKYTLSTLREEGLDPRNILIVGMSRRAKGLISQFEINKEYGLKVCSILDPDISKHGTSLNGIKIIGGLARFKKTVKDLKIDEVFFALDFDINRNIEQQFLFLDLIGVNYHITMNESVYRYVSKFKNIKPVSVNYYGISVLSFKSVPADYFKLFFKNIIERIFAIVLLIISFPVLFAVGLIIKISSKGPIIFKQKRVGLHGRLFNQYKLRSMIVDADKMKEALSHLNEQSGPVFKIKNDPRLTSIGKFIRKYSIDELPQLVNIISGDMSLIGPRPPVPSEVENYGDYETRRLSMKPGITGLWQVSGRNHIKEFSEWVRLDLEYIDNWSFVLDLKIAFRTIRTVFSGSGM